METKRDEDESRLLLPICLVWRVDYMSEDRRSKENDDLTKTSLDQLSLTVVVMVVLRLWSRTFLLLQRVPSERSERTCIQGPSEPSSHNY